GQMNCGDAAVDQIENLLGCDCGGYQLARGAVIVEALKAVGDPSRHRSATALGEAGGGLEILHGQNPRYDRNIDPPRTHAVEVTKIEIVIEEELGHCATGAGV